MIKLTIGEYIRLTDIDTYRRLQKLCGGKIDKRKEKIQLGDTVENLMKHDSYKRVKGALRQTKWG